MQESGGLNCTISVINGDMIQETILQVNTGFLLLLLLLGVLST